MTSTLGTVSSEAPTGLQPVAIGDRIDLVDIVRGFALYGVLLANLVWITTDVVLTDARLAQLPTAPLDRIVQPLVVFFVDGKFYTLFSFLFGLGFAIQLGRADQRGRAIGVAYARRVAILAVIGFLHIAILWYGDILLIYAVGGFLLLLVRQWSSRVILVMAFALALCAQAAVGIYPLLAGQPPAASLDAAMQDDAEKERKLAVFDGSSYRALAAENRSYYYGHIVERGVVLFLLPQVFARFLLGLIVGRMNWAYSSAALVPVLRRLLPWTIGAGLAGSGVRLLIQHLRRTAVIGLDSYWVHASTPIQEAGVLALAFSYLALIVIAFHQSATWRRRLEYLAPVGRMALTNYLTHSVLYLLLFTGVGLGWYGDVGPALCVVLSITIFAVQMAFSRWWLVRYRFGPAEWVWRTLTYGQLQPMRASARLAAAVGVILATTAVGRSQTPVATSSSLAITNVTVVDTVSGALQPDMTVVVTGERITEVAPAARVRVAEGTERVDGRERFLIPGLWDMHSHWSDTASASLSLLVANGVTGTRVMWGRPVHRGWRREIEAGALVGPRLVIGSAIFDGPQPIWPGSVAIRGEADARQAVIEAKRDGAEFVKIYEKLSRDAFFAVAAEARRQGLPFVGHIPPTVSVAEATAAGQGSFEHEEFVRGTSRDGEDALRKLANEVYATDLKGQLPVAVIRASRRLAVTPLDRGNALALFAELKKNSTWVCPTITAFRSFFGQGLPADPRLKYVPTVQRSTWIASAKRVSPDLALSPEEHQQYLEVIRLLRIAGVGLLAGTDVGAPFLVPGFSLHEEVAFMVDGGLTPLEALQTATLNPARFFDREKDLGTVATGKLADLVLLDANPLTAISNTTRINAVVANGRLFRRVDLDELLAKAEAAASK